ncbi:MAG: glycosyltransferase [Bryobacterales bacterium]|nr:glycosyltransferase [Bryobacterales bacterium]
MNPIGVLHVIDSLDVGGAERLAVNLVNCLPRERYRPYLCTTRRAGPLLNSVHSDVTVLNLARRTRFDLAALNEMKTFVRKQEIRVLHAHGPAVFFSKLVAMWVPGTILIWHAHYGGLSSQNLKSLLYRVACAGATIITVNENLATWARERLGVSPERVHYLQNFVEKPQSEFVSRGLPGEAGFRIAYVANIRSEKDHITLLRSLATVLKRYPRTHLLFIGSPSDRDYYDLVCKSVVDFGLSKNVSFLGPVQDVYSVLRACDIGVLSSEIEGLPMALLEYGMAGLPTVATRVGQCAEVLNNGRAGILVDSRSTRELGRALEYLLEFPERRRAFGAIFREHVEQNYSSGAVLTKLSRIYENLLRSHQTPETAAITTEKIRGVLHE